MEGPNGLRGRGRKALRGNRMDRGGRGWHPMDRGRWRRRRGHEPPRRQPTALTGIHVEYTAISTIARNMFDQPPSAPGASSAMLGEKQDAKVSALRQQQAPMVKDLDAGRVLSTQELSSAIDKLTTHEGLRQQLSLTLPSPRMSDTDSARTLSSRAVTARVLESARAAGKQMCAAKHTCMNIMKPTRTLCQTCVSPLPHRLHIWAQGEGEARRGERCGRCHIQHV
jgi:hypothetical protein